VGKQVNKKSWCATKI